MQDPHADLRVGWDNESKHSGTDCRVAIVARNYVLVIRLRGAQRADFVTTFMDDNATVMKIRRNPRWA